MKRKEPWFATLCLVLCCCQGRAAAPGAIATASPAPQLPELIPIQATQKQEDPPPRNEERSRPPATPSPSEERQRDNSSSTRESDQPNSGEGEASAQLGPQMLGDFLGGYSLRFIVVPSVQTITSTQSTTTFVPMKIQLATGEVVVIQVPNTVTTTSNTTVPVRVVETVRVPIASRGGFKITENESPIPQDRVFLTYNYFSNVTGPASTFSVPSTTMQMTTLNGFPATVSTLFPGVVAVPLDAHRETLGFEKTFLDKNASIELRLPFFEETGGLFDNQGIGDMTLVLKCALYNDRECGNVISTGMALTAPTGPEIQTYVGNINSFLLQPFVGYLWNKRPFYVQGFSSVVVPTDTRDVTLLFNDIAAGFQLYHGGKEHFLRFVTPTLEAHVTTPLNHRGITDPIVVPDLVVLTAGVHFGLGCRSTLTLGAVTPVTGPRVFDIEAMAQFNWRF